MDENTTGGVGTCDDTKGPQIQSPVNVTVYNPTRDLVVRKTIDKQEEPG